MYGNSVANVEWQNVIKRENTDRTGPHSHSGPGKGHRSSCGSNRVRNTCASENCDIDMVEQGPSKSNNMNI